MIHPVFLSLVGSLITLYMLVILLYWTGPWIELDFYRGYWRLIPKVSEPLVRTVRRFLPVMGPMDWAPLAAVMILWLLRILLVQY